jgi:hypothetical protein
MVAMRPKLGGLLAAMFAPALAYAQADIPNDRAIDVQTFEYAIGPKTFFTVADADVADKKQLALDALVTYLTRPFRIYNYDEVTMTRGSERTVVVESIAAGQITGAYGVTDKLHVGVNLPLIFALSGDGLRADTATASCAMPPCLKVTGLGDLAVEGKYRLYRKNGIKLAALGGATLPTSVGSDGSEFIGDNLPTLRARIALQFDPNARFSFGVNGGVVLRKPRTIYDSTVGPQLTWGVAAALRVTDRFSIIGESFGRAGLPTFSLDASPLEVEGGVRVYATSAFAVVVGAGSGLSDGAIGSPDARFFLSIGYAPDVRDSDNDGVPNSRDRCLLVPEDRDGAQDDDGCPDDDNDGDRRPDNTDQCPAQAEDIDGFEDDDGCPETDNDKDGLVDLDDKCINDAEDGREPNPKDGCPASKRDFDVDNIMDDVDKCPRELEDVDGFEDADGCPEPDNDQDGVADDADQCPVCPEDRDNFEDGDGCPELDNDRDGVADASDKCPNEAETINGITDGDGCPDAGGTAVARIDGDRLVIDRIPTLAGGKLSPAGVAIVDQMALVMLAQPDVTKWLVALAQPNPTDAAALAAAVKARLIQQGLVEARFDIIGAAGVAKIGGVVQERSEAGARPACPAGRAIQPRPEASKPPPAP